MLSLILFIGLKSVIAPIPVDRVEHNTCYTEQGKVQYNQVIVWEWCDTLKTYVVQEFVLVDEPPILTKGSSSVTITFYNRRDGRLVRLRTKQWTETKTLTSADPEMLNRSILPMDKRRKLW